MNTMSLVDAPLVETRVGPDAWPSAIAAAEGPQIVVGGPGTGKSEFLVRRLHHLVAERGVTPDRILALSFSRRGAADLQRRIRSALTRTVGELDITTFHSFSARLLESRGSYAAAEGPLQVLTGPEQTAFVRRLLAAENPEDWSVATRPLLGTATFAAEVTDFVLRVSERLIDDDELEILAAARNEWRGLPGFVRRYHRALAARSRIDYSGLVARAVAVLTDPASRAPDIEYVLVDEYQDTTASQVALIDALTRGRRNVTVAADPYQSVYSFRGAALTNVSTFEDRFGTGDRPASRIILTTSFRTPGRILEAGAAVTAGAELPGAAGPVIPAPGDGRVEVCVFDQQTAEAEWVADEIQRLHLADRLPLSSIGVFVRSKRRFLPELSRALDRRHLAHDDPDARLAEQPAVRFVLDLVRAATGCDGENETAKAMRRILLGPLIALPFGELRAVEERMRREGIGWAAALVGTVGSAPLVAFLADPDWATDLPADDGFWEVWTGLPQLRAVAVEPDRREERAAWTSLGQVLARWTERNPSASLVDYLRLVEEEDFEASPLLSYRRPGEDRVTLTTLHQCKGLEFEVVFIADAVDGVFPDLRPRDSFLGTRHLLPHLPTATAGYTAFRLQEERRLAYTAMSRARARVVWTATSSGSDDGRGRPSR
ncbi:MAG: ATP-dependent helicase, partial [Acidimicrobiia bacterium]